jgi:regulator of RNase E activity RraA
VLPGDIVLGTPTGVIFIPAHLAQAVVERSEDVRVRDQFGKLRLQEGRYTPGEIDRTWSEAIEADYKEWRAASQSATRA